MGSASGLCHSDGFAVEATELQMLPAGGPVGANFFILCMLPGPDPISSSLLNPSCALCTWGLENWGPRPRKKGKLSSVKKLQNHQYF